MNKMQELMLSWKDTKKKNNRLDLFFKKETWNLKQSLVKK